LNLCKWEITSLVALIAQNNIILDRRDLKLDFPIGDLIFHSD